MTEIGKFDKTETEHQRSVRGVEEEWRSGGGASAPFLPGYIF